MKKLKILAQFFLIGTTPALLAHPGNFSQFPSSVSYVNEEPEEKIFQKEITSLTYDDILKFLEEIESGEFEKKCTPEELEQVNQFIVFLARKGILPDDSEEDIEDLLQGDNNPFEYTFSYGNAQNYMLIPSLFSGGWDYQVLHCGRISSCWEKTKKFIRNHKKEIIIGAVVVVAVTVVVLTVGAAAGTGAAAGGAGVISNAGASDKDKDDSRSGVLLAAQTPPQVPSNDSPFLKEALDQQVTSFKNMLMQEVFFQPTSQSGLSYEETGRVVGPLFAHDSFNQLNRELPYSPHLSHEIESIRKKANFSLPIAAQNHPLDFGHSEIDRKFSSNYASFFSTPEKEGDFNALSHQLRGEKALSFGHYKEAAIDLTKAIDLTPTDPIPYLQRSGAYFRMGEYDRSIEDFQTFTEKAPKDTHLNSLSFSEFNRGFELGLPQGIWESGKGVLLFLSDFINHPVQTSAQIVEAFSTLAKLVKEDEWGLIGEALSPEIHQLVTQWDTIPSEKRGKLAGYALGKVGTDILIPGAVAKIASKSIKSAKELVAICKNISIANETLVLETAAGMGNSAKIGEVIEAGQRTARFADEMGFTAKEMGQLKQAGKLEITLQDKLNHLSLPQQESIRLFLDAEKSLSSYKGFGPEHEIRNLIHKTAIPTFPRPKGIPKNYRVKLSNTGAGMKYVHPKDKGTYVRVMPGKVHSNNPCQQKPYVNHRIHGESVDKFGKKVPTDSVEAHIPLEEFIYRDF